MYIKEIQERRKQQEQQEQDQINNQAKIKIHKIGSIKNGKVNYDQDEQFFSPEDIPQQNFQAKQQMNQFTDPDLLGLRKKEWNNSVSIPLNQESEETHERQLIKIKLGLFDQPQPKIKDKIIEPGTDTRNDYTGWNVSTEIDGKFRKTQLNDLTQTAQLKNKSKEQVLLTDYVNPKKRQSDYNEMLRMKKQEEKPFRDQIREEYEFQNPDSSKEKTDAAVFRQTYEIKLRKNQINRDNTATFKPELISEQNRNQVIKSNHTGNWQMMGFERDDDGNQIQMMAWSCCMNEDQNSEGCNKVVQDKDKWNLISFTSK